MLFEWKTCENESEISIPLNESGETEHQRKYSDYEEDKDNHRIEIANNVQSYYEILMLILLPINFCLNGVAFFVFGKFRRNVLSCLMSRLCGADMVYQFTFGIIIIFYRFYSQFESRYQIAPISLSGLLILSSILSMQTIFHSIYFELNERYCLNLTKYFVLLKVPCWYQHSLIIKLNFQTKN